MNSYPSGLLRPYQSKLNMIYRISDGIWILIILWAAVQSFGAQWNPMYLLAAALSMGIFYILAEILMLYNSWRGAPFYQYGIRVALAWIPTTFILMLIGYFAEYNYLYPGAVMGTWMLAVPVVLALWRFGVRALLAYFRRHGFNSRSVGIVGATEAGARLAEVIRVDPCLGLSFKGFYDDRVPCGSRITGGGDCAIAGDLSEIVRQARNGKVDLVYITLPMQAQTRIVELLKAFSDTTASVYFVPDFFIYDLLHARWINLGPIPTLSIFETPFQGTDGWLKRAEDILMCLLILPLITLPMLFIAASVRRSSPGPVFFKQRRYGLDGREIKVWKFRTMTVCDDGDRVVQAIPGDRRVTPIGAFLRRTSLDELPQFFNVLGGTMSVVGPRPHAVAHNEHYRTLVGRYMLRHKVKPGITGWAQVNGWRGETQHVDKMRQRVEHDLEYIKRWSLWLDCKIIVKTVVTGFSGLNAY